jgi:hypothetical protein
LATKEEARPVYMWCDACQAHHPQDDCPLGDDKTVKQLLEEAGYSVIVVPKSKYRSH